MAEVLLTMVHTGGGVRRLEVLKQIWPELATDPDFVTMFLDEARLSLRLNHANVVQTYEVLSGGGQLAIAMEYLDGQPLTRVLNRLMRGPNALSLPLRLRVLMNVLAGLEHAHTLTDLDGTPLEVVHRDVSPQNVFVTYDGRVKLVDFGVAKTLAASHNTRPGAVKGKLAYMAPEQLQCASVDRRADLFAVGVMLWEMLAARRMWHGKTEVDIVESPGERATVSAAAAATPACRRRSTRSARARSIPIRTSAIRRPPNSRWSSKVCWSAPRIRTRAISARWCRWRSRRSGRSGRR